MKKIMILMMLIGSSDAYAGTQRQEDCRVISDKHAGFLYKSDESEALRKAYHAKVCVEVTGVELRRLERMPRRSFKGFTTINRDLLGMPPQPYNHIRSYEVLKKVERPSVKEVLAGMSVTICKFNKTTLESLREDIIEGENKELITAMIAQYNSTDTIDCVEEAGALCHNDRKVNYACKAKLGLSENKGMRGSETAIN